MRRRRGSTDVQQEVARFPLGLPRRSMLSIFAALAIGACSADSTSPAFNFSGTYQITQVTQPVSCLPQLPTPVSTDVTAYVQPPSVLTTESLRFLITQTGSQFTVTPLDAHGTPVTGSVLSGIISSDGTTSVSRTLVLGTEGPRQGGHTFFVSLQTNATGHYQATGAQVQQSGSATNTYTYRDGGVNGQVFATCVSTFSTTGSRVGS